MEQYIETIKDNNRTVNIFYDTKNDEYVCYFILENTDEYIREFDTLNHAQQAADDYVYFDNDDWGY